MDMSNSRGTDASWSKLLLGNTLDSKFALLALSHKAGSVSIWTQSLDHGMQYAAEVSPHTSFVNLVSWSAWKKINETTYVALLASSSTNGTVTLSTVQVNLSKGDKQSIENVQMRVSQRWFENDITIPTLLKVYNDAMDDSSYFNIAVCKGVTVYMMRVQVTDEGNIVNEYGWEPYTLFHSGAGLSAGSWINQNTFRCYTFEGEGLYLTMTEDGRVKKDEEQTYKLNQKLIQKYKQQWMEEQIKIEEEDILGASDAIPYLWGASDGRNKIITAIYCTMKPTVDVHYRPESEEDSTIAFILQKERGIGVDDACDDLDRYAYNPDFIFTYPVQAIVHETLEYLLNEDDMSDFKMWVIKLDSLLQQRPELDDKDLTRALFSSPSTIAARIVINAEIKLKHYNLLQATSAFEDTCRKAKHIIQLYYLSHTLDLALRLSDDEFSNLGEQDMTELLILSDLALALRDEQLIQTASQVYTRLQKSFSFLDLEQELEYATRFNLQSSAEYTLKPREKCPVCSEAVNAIGNSSLAQCNAGHLWELCSITKRVLRETKARKCLTCGAKSLIAKDNTFTDAILRGCSRCINCGSGFYFQ
ncbi:unnamed protein product [Rhizopus microsporus]